MKAKATSIAVASTKFLLGMRYCMVDSDVGTGDSSLVLGTLHVNEHAHVHLHVSPSMDCICTKNAQKMTKNLSFSQLD